MSEHHHRLCIGAIKLAAVAALAMLADVRVPDAALDTVPAANAMIDEHAVANLWFLNPRSYRDHLSTRLVTGDDIVHGMVPAWWTIPMEIAPANGGSSHCQDDLTRTWPRVRLVTHDCLVVAKELDSAHE